VPRKTVQVDKLQLIRNKAKQDRMLGWQEDSQKGLRIVVLKNVFEPSQDLETLKKEILREAEENIGKVERVRVFQDHPEGVVELKFHKPSAAERCVEVMNGRFYSGKKLECFFWDGKTDYRKVISTQNTQET